VVEGEVVAVDQDTEELRSFQLLMRRRRKHKIREIMKKIPVNVYLFDCLYANGRDLTIKPYLTRRNTLKNIIETDGILKITPFKETSNPKTIERFFHQAISEGCEGLIVKSTDKDSIYQAGARSWRWIKLKRSYQSKLAETLDLVIVGAMMGRGKRTGTYGAILTAAYDKNKDEFPTVCKVGSGWTDQDLIQMPKKLKPYKLTKKHPQVNSLLEADIWFKPKVVIEVNADEITLSPIHPCGIGIVSKDSGLALRFPRFTGRWRPDKAVRDATTINQVIQIYKSQQKSVK
jgi:DNA ligase-1